MKSIYLVYSSPRTLASNLIRFYSKSSISHVGISLDSSLKDIYSFSREFSISPVPGCANIESLDSLIYHKSLNTSVVVEKIEVKNEDYDRIKEVIDLIFMYDNIYDFRSIMLKFIYSLFSLDDSKLKRKYGYFCSSFVAEVLRSVNLIDQDTNIISYKPNDLMYLFRNNIVYDGSLDNLINLLGGEMNGQNKIINNSKYFSCDSKLYY